MYFKDLFKWKVQIKHNMNASKKQALIRISVYTLENLVFSAVSMHLSLSPSPLCFSTAETEKNSGG